MVKASGKALLISSTNFEFQPAMPLGLITLATQLDHLGIHAQIFDLPMGDTSETHLDKLVELTREEDWLFIGLSTMCDTFPRTLRVAKEFRAANPLVPIVLGGPQVTMYGYEVLSRYQFIDGLVLGESEAVLPDLVNALIKDGPECAINIPGVVFRKGLKNVLSRRLPVAPIVPINEILPVDYSSFPRGNAAQTCPIEVGRGCPYACTFCSTKDFFKRNFRLKGKETICAEIQHILETSPHTFFDFMHDMFTTNRKLVFEFCEYVLSTGLKFNWGCSARTDRVDQELLNLMYRAGCRTMYFGIETGSQRIQKIVKKKLDVLDAEKKIALAASLGISSTVSLILGFPDEEEGDVADTVDLAIRLRSYRPKLKAIQVHLLSPLSGTELEQSLDGNIYYDGHVSDISSVNNLTEWEEQQILEYNDIFSSFYYIQNPHIPRMVYRRLYWILFFANRFDNFFHLLCQHEENPGRLLTKFVLEIEESSLDDMTHPNASLVVPRVFELLQDWVLKMCDDEKRRDVLSQALDYGKEDKRLPPVLCHRFPLGETARSCAHTPGNKRRRLCSAQAR